MILYEQSSHHLIPSIIEQTKDAKILYFSRERVRSKTQLILYWLQFKLVITVMPNEHDFDESIMDEAVPTIRVPIMAASQVAESARLTQNDLICDLQKMMEDERNKEQKRIKLLKQKQTKIGEEVNKRLAAKDRRIRQLEQEQTKKVFTECTFKPKTSTKGSNRSLEEFLQQQSQFTKKIQQKRMTLKQNLELKKQEKNTFQPKTNKTQERKRQGTVFDRLYALKDKQNEDDGNNSRVSEDFHPKITQKGKRLARNGPIDELLYKDALRRQQKAKEVQFQSQSNVVIASRGLNINNQKYVAQKFIKQYFAVIDKLQVPPNLSAKIDYMLFNEILKQMGFVQVQEQSESSHERTLIHQAYQFLQNFKVNARNICVFLLALVGVFHINPVNFQQNEQRITEEELALDEAEGRKVQKNFDLFKRNRLFSENLRRQNVPQGHIFSFKPQINKSSDQLAQKYRQQMLQEVNQVLQLYPQINFNVPKDGVISPTDLLVMYNKAKEIKLQNRKEEMNQQQIQNCTFKPATLNQSQGAASLKWSSASGNLGQKKSFQLYSYHRELQSKKESLRVSRQSQDPTMKQCTFAPKMSKKKVTTDTSNFNTKQVQEALYRMKRGRQQWESKNRFMQRGEPLGQSKQLKLSTKDAIEEQKVQETPILLLDVNLGTRVERLTLFSGDEQRLKQVATQFASKHELDEQSENRLLQLLQIQMENVLAKIPEDQQSDDNVQQ